MRCRIMYTQERGISMRIKKKGAIRILLLVSGSLMLIYGIFRNEVTYVFNKAVKICLECIGIG